MFNDFIIGNDSDFVGMLYTIKVYLNRGLYLVHVVNCHSVLKSLVQIHASNFLACS